MLAILTTISFQITSNFANDYGDGIKGTDNEARVGPKRALQSGSLTERELKIGIGISIALVLLLSATLLLLAFGAHNWGYLLIFALLALLGTWAAVKYTVGDSAYGYKGLGDLFVFIFFGLVSVLGSMFLYTQFLSIDAWLPAIAVGCLSVGVLNLNNLRDHDSDALANKNTLIVKIGVQKGKKYHYFLLAIAFLGMLGFVLRNAWAWYHMLPILAFIPVLAHAVKVYRNQKTALLDGELKKLSLSTFFMAILFFVTYYNF